MWFEMLLVCILLVYLLAKQHYSFWKNQNIPGPTPVILFGNIKDCFFGKKAMWEIFSDIYRSYPQYPFIGIFRATTPCILIRDPALIRDIQISNFKCFSHNGFQIDIKNDPIFGRNVFFLKDSEWKTTRNVLIKGFTTETMKSAFSVFNENGRQMVHYLRICTKNKIKTNAKDLCEKFTAHNVAVWAFGLELNDIKESDSEFRKLARDFLSTEHIPGFVQLLAVIAPSILKLFSIKIIPKNIENKLIKIIKESEKQIRAHNIHKNDFFQYLMECNNNNQFSEEELTAFAASFLIDGYETSSLVMSFILLELALNQNCQNKLRNEIKSILNNEEVLSPATLQQMVYLNACINETLRKHPVLAFNIKECTKEYTFNSECGKSTILKPGQLVVLPIDAIQNDPKYFDQPEKFIPERMLDSNIRNTMAFMPFGVGPRACLGKHYGMLQLKVGVVHLLLNCKISINETTKLPIKYDPWSIVKFPKGGIWLDLEMV